MIQTGTFLDVVDNLGVKELKCIRSLGSLKKRYGVLGDIVTASVKEVRQRKNKKAVLKKGDVVLALIVQTTIPVNRFDGQRIRFLKNSGVILDKQKKLLGSRIAGPACKELHKNKNFKFTSLSSFLV